MSPYRTLAPPARAPWWRRALCAATGHPLRDVRRTLRADGTVWNRCARCRREWDWPPSVLTQLGEAGLRRLVELGVVARDGAA